MKEMTLKNTHLVVSRHIKGENASLPVDARRSKTFLLKLPILFKDDSENFKRTHFTRNKL